MKRYIALMFIMLCFCAACQAWRQWKPVIYPLSKTPYPEGYKALEKAALDKDRPRMVGIVKTMMEHEIDYYDTLLNIEHYQSSRRREWSTEGRTSALNDVLNILHIWPTPWLAQMVYELSSFIRQRLLVTDELIYTAHDTRSESLIERRRQLMMSLAHETDWFARFALNSKLDTVEMQLMAAADAQLVMINLETSMLTNHLYDYLQNDEAIVEFVRFREYKNGVDSGEYIYGAIVLTQHQWSPVYFVAGPSSIHYVPLCTARELDSLLNVSDKDAINSLYASRKLYNKLWAPIQSRLLGVRRVYFTPVGALYGVSVEALGGRNGKCEMLRMSSGREILQVFENRNRNKAYAGYDDAAFFGDATYTTSPAALSRQRAGVGQLGFSGQEVDKAAQVMTNSGGKASTYTGAGATERQVIDLSGNSPDIMHFSTHAFAWSKDYAEKHPFYEEMGQINTIDGMMRCGLLFTGANAALRGGKPLSNSDGVLTASEVAALDLTHTDLVVLSACNSALGDVTAEGVYGLQRAFRMAGVKTIVMSLWAVDDEATALLMSYFYEELLDKSKGYTPHQALAKAQQRLRSDKRFEAPYYWAGFVCAQ